MSTLEIHGKEIRTRDLDGKTIAILTTDGFEQSELMEPREALAAMGADVHVIGPSETLEADHVRGWDQNEWGESVELDQTLDAAKPADFDALLLPGGVMNPDRLRTRTDATAFVRAFFEDGKPVAAICHGAQTLIDCGVLEGRAITSYPSIKTDLKNAGARWEDREVVCDQGLVTSRDPDDIPAFVETFGEEVAEGRHAEPASA